MISEIRSLSADCLPSLIKASACGIFSASQLFGRSVAYFFNPIRVIIKKQKCNLVLIKVRDETRQQFFKKTIQLIEAGVRDSCGKSASKGDPTGAKSAEEAPGPPAESECLEATLFEVHSDDP
ncbi:hypothetical protein ACWGJQ_22710 [Peribacillus simplex]